MKFYEKEAQKFQNGGQDGGKSDKDDFADDSDDYETYGKNILFLSVMFYFVLLFVIEYYLLSLFNDNTAYKEKKYDFIV